jgi:hypothetical protein
MAYFNRATLDGLKARGFKVNNGWKDTGLMLTVFNKAGSYYIGKGHNSHVCTKHADRIYHRCRGQPIHHRRQIETEER